jgi:hypothetical protein
VFGLQHKIGTDLDGIEVEYTYEVTSLENIAHGDAS